MLDDDKIKVAKSVSIVEVFNRLVVPLRKNIYNYDITSRSLIHCPFHDDSTPSFKIYLETNSFYCFGCGEGGDVINFVKSVYKQLYGVNISFKDALDILLNNFEKYNISYASNDYSNRKFDNNFLNKKLFELYFEFNNSYNLDKIKKLYELIYILSCGG